MTHEAMWEQVEADLLTELPIVARITSVALLVHDGTRWRQRGPSRCGSRERGRCDAARRLAARELVSSGGRFLRRSL
ncbi:hypothetical protein ACFXA4_04675 [Streptomyces sp. NPDC059442]|uniref:hypothetical protein n=1 Tax=Streptomyces sp. NPDC059442 TaxID=3346830 RepID=UPI0036B5BD56